MLDQELLKLLESDTTGLLNIEQKIKPITSNDRLVESFLEINNFYKENNAEPRMGPDMHQSILAMRLNGVREDSEKKKILKDYDEFNLLDPSINSTELDNLKDLLENDNSGLLNIESTDIFDIKNVSNRTIENPADFVAKRKHCKNFSKHEGLFKQVQMDLSAGSKQVKNFKDRHQIKEGVFFVLSGVVGCVVGIGDLDKNLQRKINGRLHIVFENGTESNMLLRSLVDALHANEGRIIEDTNIAIITENDNESGYIYILRSLSDNPEIQNLKDLYKIGFCTTSVEERIKNAKDDPTYLMAPVHIVANVKCFNMNTQKLERLLHRFFAETCLNIDITDNNQNRYTPKEWFIAPLEIIEQAIHLIISGEILNYKYDKNTKEIIKKI